jgi:hypothetical protein
MKTQIVLFFLFASLSGFSQSGNKTIDETFQTLTQNENSTYFEVTKEMFKMLSEIREAPPEYKEYISKLHKLKLIQVQGEKNQSSGNDYYNLFLQQANLKDYSRLMTKKEGHSQLSFYKKEGKNENEFLLVSTDMIIYITGTIDLKSISEFEQVMEIAGSAFDI